MLVVSGSREFGKKILSVVESNLVEVDMPAFLVLKIRRTEPLNSHPNRDVYTLLQI